MPAVAVKHGRILGRSPLRGRARLLEAEIDSAARALDDAEEALRLARDCGYA